MNLLVFESANRALSVALEDTLLVALAKRGVRSAGAGE